MKKEPKFFFSVVEEFILNPDWIKKHGKNYRAGRIEVWHKDEPYDVDEIAFCFPEEIFEAFYEALDFKHCDYFHLGDICSEEIEERLNEKKQAKQKTKKKN